MKKYFKSCICVLIVCITIFLPVYSFANTLENQPNQFEKIDYVRKEKDRRMQSLIELGINMERYAHNCDDCELERRFERFSYDRWRVYFSNIYDYGKPNAVGIYKEEYKVPKNWRINWNTRHEFPFSFEYNIAYEKYNASIIVSDRNCFLAIEAPSSKNIHDFYSLIDNYNVGYFVKLNAPDEYGEDYYQFWANESINNHTNIIIGKNKYINLFSYIWPHRQAGDINRIVNISTNIYNDNSDKVIAVSCRAGAGRTGTFIAAYILIDEINYQLEHGISSDDIDVSIDKIIWELTVQRAYAITHCTQYKNLYRIADYYLHMA